MTSIFYLLRKREQSTMPDLVTWGGDQTNLCIPFSLRDYYTTLSDGSQFMQWRRMLIVFNQKECEFAQILLRDETYHQVRHIVTKYESIFCHTCQVSLFRWDLPDFHTYFCTLHTFCDSQFSSRFETKQPNQNFSETPRGPCVDVKCLKCISPQFDILVLVKRTNMKLFEIKYK